VTVEDSRARRRARIRRRLHGQTSTRSAAQLLGPITVAAVLVILILGGRDVLRKALTDEASAPMIGPAEADATVELEAPPALEATITVTVDAVLVAGELVVRLDGGAVRPADLAPDGTITPLAARLRTARAEQPPEEDGPPWKRVAVVAAHRNAPYGVVRAVAATARAVGLTEIRYASPDAGD
jgi:hypothetical protein